MYTNNHSNSYFPDKVPSQWKCNMAAQVRTENVIDWKKQYIMGMVMCLQLNGDQYPIKSFPQMWIFALLWWRLAEACHLIFWLNFYVALSWRFDRFYCSSFYNYLWKQPILTFSTQIPDFNEILHSSACLKREILWADNFNQFLHPWGERFQMKPVTMVAGTKSDARKKTTPQESSRPWRNNKHEQARSCTWVEENAKQNVEPWILKDLLSLKTLHGLSTTEMPVILPSEPTKE